MNKKVIKPLLFSVLTLSSITLASCNVSKDGVNSSKDIKYTIKFKGLDDFKKNFVKLGDNTLLEGYAMSFDTTNKIDFKFTEALDPTNLKIYCNNEPATFEITNNSDFDSYNNYIPHIVTCDSVTIAGKKHLDYLVDVTDCTINYANVNFDLESKYNLNELKYYIESNPETIYTYGKTYTSFDTTKVDILDFPEDNIIKQPAGTRLSLFAPSSWDVDEFNFIYGDNARSNTLFSIDPYENEKAYEVKIGNNPYKMFTINHLASDGTIVTKESYEKQKETQHYFNDRGLFNIVALKPFNASGYDMFMDIDVHNSIYPEIINPNKHDILTFNDNGKEITLLRDNSLSQHRKEENEVFYATYPMRFNDESHEPGYKVYDAYFTYPLYYGSTITKSNYQEISFGLYDDNFNEPKVVIPSSDIKLVTKHLQGRDDLDYIIFKITPEMIAPYVKDYVFENRTKDSVKEKAGHLFLLPIIKNTNKFAKLTWDFEHVNPNLNTTGLINKITNARITKKVKDFETSINPLITLDENNKLISLLDKTNLDTAKFEFTVTGNANSEISPYINSKIKSISIKKGLAEYYDSEMDLDNGDFNFNLPFSALNTSTDNYDLKVKINLLDNFKAKLNFTNVANNSNYEVYYSTTMKNLNEFTKITQENVDSMNIELQPRNKKPESRFYYYIKPLDPKNTSYIELNFLATIDTSNDDIENPTETYFFKSETLVDIYSNPIEYNGLYVFYVDTINCFFNNYNENLKINVEISK